MYILRMITVALAVATCWSGDVCPPRSSLPDCRCRNVDLQIGTTLLPGHKPQIPARRAFYTLVHCGGFRTPQALEENVSRGLHRKNVDELLVSSVPPHLEHRLARLPRGWLRHVRVKKFQTSNSNMSGDFIWFEDPFEGQTTYLRQFGAHHCALQGALTYTSHTGTANTKGLHNLTRLEVLDLSHNRLSVVKVSAFSYPPTSLSTLRLAWNSLEAVEPGAFLKLARLDTLDLSHNLLERVDRKIFSAPVPRIREINLSWNYLKSLPPDFLSEMPSLRVLYVNNNFLFSMPENPWIAVWKELTEVDVSGNYIECDCSLFWLVSPAVGGNGVSYIRNLLPSVGRRVRGQCSASNKSKFYNELHNIGNLTRSQINC